MSRIGGPILASPVPGMRDLHLIVQVQNAAADSLLYIPATDEPALATDVLRIDRIRGASFAPDAFLKWWLAQYKALAGDSRIDFTLVKASDELLFQAGFAGHPIIGAHHAVVRCLRGNGGMYVLQFMRKRNSLEPGELDGRVAFLGAHELEPQIFSTGAPAYSEYASTVHRNSAKLAPFLQRPAESGLKELPIEALGSLLVGASPFQDELLWANLARYYGRTAMVDGHIDQFGRAAACLSCALVTLYDSREVEDVANMLYRTAGNLADLLMYLYGAGRAENLARALALYRLLAEHWQPVSPGDALEAGLMAGLGWLLNHPDSQEPVDSGLSQAVTPALRQKQQSLAAVEALHEYGNRIAYIARQKQRALYNDAGLAADLAQVILERAQIDGKFGAVEHSGALARIFQDQINAQLGLHGITQEDLDQSAKEFAARYRPRGGDVPQLVFLRPLATARRIPLRHQFGASYAGQLSAIVPGTLSLEAAIHIAFMSSFRTTALGGAIDIFGMERETATGGKSSDPLKSWQKAASQLIQYSSVILVLFNDSEGLLWEISEIARQKAFGKVIFISPPRDPAEPVHRSTSIQQRFQRLGLDLPFDDPQPGFWLTRGDGGVYQKLAFDALWSGALLQAVLGRMGKMRAM